MGMSKIRLPLTVLGVLCTIGCGEGAAEDRELGAIREDEGVMAALIAQNAPVDWEDATTEQVVRRLLKGYADYANRHHGDSLSAIFLMRRADLLQGRGDADAAVSQWRDVAEGYPGTRSAPEAIFRMGFMRETVLDDGAGAREAYTELIRVYPDSPWSEQARWSLKWLGLNDEELIRSLSAGSEGGE